MEVALRVTGRRVAKAKYDDFRPRGSVMAAISDRAIRMKWIEICACLMSPAKRAAYAGFRYARILVPLWKQAWLDAYLAAERHQIPHNDVWTLIASSGAVQAALGNEPGNRVPAWRAWDWSNSERRLYALIGLDETTLPIGEKLGNQGEFVRRSRLADGRSFNMPRHRIRWHLDLGISAATVAAINDPAVIVHPRLDLKRSFTNRRTSTTPVG